MNTQFITQKSFLLKFLKFLKIHSSGMTLKLQEDSLNQQNLSFARRDRALHQVYKEYSLERRYFF